MRIQHNIASLNSYRNYTNNTTAVSKNLEKLSSGYRINRAGDDAAGLAISEKMRAQITGLETAQKNAADGISLVQTAEGALTEVHTMLNRMVELADQSANGTYDNEVDRANLQKEVQNLKDEIDRIADGTNFNGINLLDGTLGGGKAGAAAGMPDIKGLTTTDIAGAKGKFKLEVSKFTTPTNDVKGAGLSYSVTVQKDGATKTYDIQLQVSDDGKSFLYNGQQVGTIADANAGKPTGKEQADALAKAMQQEPGLSEDFTITSGANGDISLESKVEGTSGAKVMVFETIKADGTETSNTPTIETAAADGYKKTTGGFPDDVVFTVNGKKFMLASTAAKAAAADKDVIVQVKSGTAANDAKALAALIEKETGYKPTVEANGDISWKANAAAGGTTGDGKGLTLQIGDTSADYNQLTVSISDTHVAALGISGVDISSQTGAKAAVDVIKAAINKVSDVRGTLGATQNRLEHTINNLSVTTENMTAAESRIRDVDVAKEMMAYTKNNILVQSAQAMLAQANQTPQGVLQLLQ